MTASWPVWGSSPARSTAACSGASTVIAAHARCPRARTVIRGGPGADVAVDRRPGRAGLGPRRRGRPRRRPTPASRGSAHTPRCACGPRPRRLVRLLSRSGLTLQPALLRHAPPSNPAVSPRPSRGSRRCRRPQPTSGRRGGAAAPPAGAPGSRTADGGGVDPASTCPGRSPPQPDRRGAATSSIARAPRAGRRCRRRRSSYRSGDDRCRHVARFVASGCRAAHRQLARLDVVGVEVGDDVEPTRARDLRPALMAPSHGGSASSAATCQRMSRSSSVRWVRPVGEERQVLRLVGVDRPHAEREEGGGDPLLITEGDGCIGRSARIGDVSRPARRKPRT